MKLLLLPLLLLTNLALSTSALPQVASSNELDKRAPAPAAQPVALPLPLPFPSRTRALEERQRGEGGQGGGGGGRGDGNGNGDGDGGDGRDRPSRPRPGRPPRDYRPDGSGRGYAVDWRGHRPPSWAEEGWQWFGRELEWGPYRGWRVPSARWEAPIEFVEHWSEYTWWAPSDSWKTYWRTHWPLEWYTFPLPDNWGGFRPRPTYTCPARVTATVTVRPRPRRPREE